MKQCGYWVVGDSDAKFGAMWIGLTYTEVEDIGKYWINRGYTLIPCFVRDEDFEEWSKENE